MWEGHGSRQKHCKVLALIISRGYQILQFLYAKLELFFPSPFLHRNCLEADSDRMMPYLQDLRLYFAAFISNIINSLPQGRDRSRLFSPEMRYSLFYVFANWCDLFTIIMTDSDQELRCLFLQLLSLLLFTHPCCCLHIYAQAEPLQPPVGQRPDGNVCLAVLWHSLPP